MWKALADGDDYKYKIDKPKKERRFDLYNFVNDIIPYEFTSKLEKEFTVDNLIIYIDKTDERTNQQIARTISDLIYTEVLKHIKEVD